MNYIHEQPVSVSVPVVCLRRNYKNKNKFKEKVKNQKGENLKGRAKEKEE